MIYCDNNVKSISVSVDIYFFWIARSQTICTEVELEKFGFFF